MFEGITIYGLKLRNFRRGAAVTLPGIGIFVGKNFMGHKPLLQHEYGHILQAKLWGICYFWFRVAPVSLFSAYKANRKGYNHQNTWTEWSANRLAYFYFNEPKDWSFSRFPIEPPLDIDKHKLSKKLLGVLSRFSVDDLK